MLHLHGLHWNSFSTIPMTNVHIVTQHPAHAHQQGQGRAGQGRAGRTLAEDEVWESQHYGNGVRKQQDNVPAPGEEGNLGHFAALPHGIHHFPTHASCSLPVGHAVRLCMQDKAAHAWGQGQGKREGASGQGRAAHGQKQTMATGRSCRSCCKATAEQ